MRRALHAEFTKLRTTPGTGWLLIAVVVATVTLSGLTGAGTTCEPATCDIDPVRQSLTGVQLGQVFAAILAITVVGGEYGNGTIGATLAAVPRRLTVAAAKPIVAATAVLAAAVVAVPAALLAGRAGLVGNGYPPFALTAAPALRAVAGSIGYLVLIGLLSVGIAMAARSATIAIGATLTLLFVFPLLIVAVRNEDLARVLYRVSPMNAGLSVQATTNLAEAIIAPLAGLGVLAAWAFVALLGGGLSLRLRDA